MKVHLAVAVTDLPKSVAEYSQLLGQAPVVVVPEEYALWRTPELNFSIRRTEDAAGTVRHVGFERDDAVEFTKHVDANGLLWETFNRFHQAEEITALWPSVSYEPSSITFRGVYPIGDTDVTALPIRAVGPAVAYYTHVLGFQLISKTNTTALLGRDDVRIGLAVDGKDPEQASCYFEVSNVEALRDELSAKGIEPSALRNEQHGSGRQRIFFAQEPFGVCFCFGQKQG